MTENRIGHNISVFLGNQVVLLVRDQGHVLRLKISLIAKFMQKEDISKAYSNESDPVNSARDTRKKPS